MSLICQSLRRLRKTRVRLSTTPALLPIHEQHLANELHFSAWSGSQGHLHLHPASIERWRLSDPKG
jgi:hypothetical protein